MMYREYYTPEVKNRIHEAMRYLVSVCDGAISDDSAGFNKPDAQWARKMLNRWPFWSYEAFDTANQRLKKYRGQLTRAGIIEEAN